MEKFGFAVMFSLLLGFSAAAAGTDVFAKPEGYAVFGSKGPAMPNANWTIHQYNATHGFSGFYPVTLGGQKMYATSSSAGWVIANASLLSMMADGTNMACTNAHNQVVEYDEMAVPPNATPLTPLSELHHAYLAGKVAMNVKLAASAPCALTMTSVGDCLTIYNATYGEVLFFQERLGGMILKSTGLLKTFGAAAGDWYQTQPPSPVPVAGQWGYDDNVTVHGYSYTVNGGMLSYDFDVLPTVKSLIAYAATNYAMDGNLGDWIIVSRYIGSGSWGPIKDETSWTSMALRED